VRKTADEIAKLVEGHRDSTYPFRDRMQSDYDLYIMRPYDAGDGYESYTSNEPRTYADKIISWMSSAELIIRIPNIEEPREMREVNDAKEKFLVGILRAADERLRRRLQPSLREQLAWFVALRGWYAGRALLHIDSKERTQVDITPWDPLHTYWGEGEEGLAWACYRIHKTKDEILQQYSIKLDEQDDETPIEVYDYYDEEHNIVCTGDTILKQATPHGADRVPVFIGMVGPQPLVQNIDNTSVTDTIVEYGESVFAPNREIYDKHNFTMSVMMEMVARSRKQGITITSRDGQKTLDEDPYKAGAEVALAQGEDIKPLGLMEVAKETGAYMGMVSGELQRGAIPHTVYGDLQFQLSGFAINTLRQGIDSVLQPRIVAMEDAYIQISHLICDQYSTGIYDPVSVSGRDRNRVYFSEAVAPDSIGMAGTPEISLVSQLPEDDMSRMSMAQMAREGPTPLLSDIYVRDKILGMQDADSIEDSIKEQMAERVLPEASLWSLLQATEDRGRPDLAQFYYGELMHLLMQKQMMRQQSMMPQQPGAPQGAGGGQGGPPTANPMVMPNAMMGVPPPAPTPQGGPNVPPGSPRPGAQNGQGAEEALRSLGLLGPRG
tara:strand:- start:357 stop:2177 length:1821 start_codon:yes stop_codon:yes gene_type:complete